METHPPTDRMTDMSENISFPQLVGGNNVCTLGVYRIPNDCTFCFSSNQFQTNEMNLHLQVRIWTIFRCRLLSVMRAMLVCGLKLVEKLDHSNGKNPVYTIHYPDLTSGTTFCLGIDLQKFIMLFVLSGAKN